ncbi:hypothetical protein ACDX78_21040 [Virgibacillus oceani]
MYYAAVRDGDHDTNFEVNHQPGAESPAFEGANLSVPYDDGESWQEVQDVEQLDENGFRAAFDQENIPVGSCFISLKIETWNTEENSIEQEIIRGYRLPVTANSMGTHVDRFESEGEFENAQAARMLKTHLTAVSQYENQGEASKVIRHMVSFNLLLDHQLDNGLIS